MTLIEATELACGINPMRQCDDETRTRIGGTCLNAQIRRYLSTTPVPDVLLHAILLQHRGGSPEGDSEGLLPNPDVRLKAVLAKSFWRGTKPIRDSY